MHPKERLITYKLSFYIALLHRDSSGPKNKTAEFENSETFH